MKKAFLLFALFAAQAVSYAQSQVDFYSVHAFSPASVKGWGGGFNMLSRPLSLPGLKNSAVRIQPGGGFYVAGAGQRSIVPSTVGTAETPSSIIFSNTHMGFYSLARFSRPSANRQMLYFDMFAGARFTNASMDTHYESNYDACTSTALTRSAGFSAGAGMGMFVRISPAMYLDLGLQWSGSTGNAKFVDMNSIRNGDGVSYTMKNTPAGMLMLKAGLSFRMSTCCNYEDCQVSSHHSKKCGHLMKE
jgi:hypothetical protein